MSAPAAPSPARFALGRRRLVDRIGDATLHGVTGAAALTALVVVGLLVYELVDQAWPAISRYGLGFVTSRAWDPNPLKFDFGALDFIYGTAFT